MIEPNEMDGTDFAVLGPLHVGSKTPAQIGCEVIDHLPRSDRPVVLRWLPEDFVRDRPLINLLQLETNVATRLDHSSILRVRGLVSFEQGWARITDFLDGESVASFLSHSPGVTPALAAEIVLQAAEAIEYAHTEGASINGGAPLIHGGVRPDTVFINFAGRAFVSGYGARVFCPSQPHPFIAPEQILGGNDAKCIATDVYGLGALLYTLISGHPPFEELPNVEETILNQSPLLPPSKGLIRELAEIALHAMAKRSTARQNSAADLAKDIRSALQKHQQVPATMASLCSWTNTIFPPSSPIRQHRVRVLDIANDPKFSESLRVEAAAESLARRTRAVHKAAAQLGPPLTSINSDRPESTDITGLSRSSPNGSKTETTELSRRRSSDPFPAKDSSRKAPTETDKPQSIPALRFHSVSPTTNVNENERTRPLSIKNTRAPTITDVSGLSPSHEASSWLSSTEDSKEVSTDRLNPIAIIRKARINSHSGSGAKPNQAHKAKSDNAEGPDTIENSVDFISESLSRSSPSHSRKSSSTASKTPPSFPRSPSKSPELALLTNRRVKGLDKKTKRKNREANSDITKFNRAIGDGSRSALLLVSLGVFGLLAMLISPALDSGSLIPKEITISTNQSIFSDASNTNQESSSKTSAHIASFEDNHEYDNITHSSLDLNSTNSSSTLKATKGTGLLTVYSEPAVDVYLEDKHLGRTPLKTRVKSGKLRLRFTDKETRINAYRQVDISESSDAQIDAVFQTSLLEVEAPSGAYIYLNGHIIAEAPMKEAIKIYEGDYLLKIVYQGMQWSKRLHVPPNREIHFSAGVQ